MHLFPESGFDQSALTPVFLGVLVSWFFTETFGWVFVGLVVPGYLATLFLLDPRSAAIDLAEACLTYAVSRLLCEHLSWTGLSSRLFGRERFLLILVVSVLVRLAFEGGLMPWAMPHAKWAYSIGLVVVPLAANSCWKTGLVRGIVQNGVPTLIVYVLLRWLLVPHTNLSLAGFHLSIEDVAASFLRSPRAYVLLLSGAVIAAVANVRYGWDYGGILIPALLALVVATPAKLAATFVEALLLVALVALLIRFTPVGRWNIEGPRRPVLFLTIDYALRFTLAAVAGRHMPGTEIVEVTGMGYLLPSLLAVKVSQRTVASVFLPTAAVSVLAFAVSSASASVVTRLSADVQPFDPPVTRRLGAAPDAPVLAALWVSALARTVSERSAVLDLERVKARGRAVNSWARGEPRALQGLEVQSLSGGFVIVRERFADLDHRHGFPAVLMSNRHSRTPRTVGLVATPLAAPQSAALAGHWLEDGAIDALVIAGVDEGRGHGAEGNEALAFARELADSTGRHGLVVAIRGSKAGFSARFASRVAPGGAARGFISRQSADLPVCQVLSAAPRFGEDLALEVPTYAADPWLILPTVAPAVATNSALALAFSESRLTSARPSLEELLVFRRLVLAPMLASEADAVPSLAVTTAAARGLGYRLLTASSLPIGGAGLLLLPERESASVALLVRVGGARGLVVEVPHAGSRPLRAFALRLAQPLTADVVLMGLEAGEGALGNEAFAEAHAAAVWPRAGRSASVVTVRVGSVTDAASLGVAEWGGLPEHATRDLVSRTLASLSLPFQVEPLDLATREQAGRSLFGKTPLVTVTVTPERLRTAEFAEEAETLRVFDRLPVYDGDTSRALISLAEALPARGQDASDAVFENASVAASERSVVALSVLEAALQSSACRASVVRADAGVFLTLAARRQRAVQVAVYPLMFATLSPPGQRLVAPSLAECAVKVARGGSCKVEARP